MSMNVQNQGTEYKIRVKSGDLAAQGKGTMTITHMPDGRFWVRVLLPSQTGGLEPLDLTAVERAELVQTKTGWFDKGTWVKPVLVTTAALIGVPVVLDAALPVSEAASAGIKALFVGTWFSGIYASGVYTGSKLTRLARFVVKTQDGKHVVLEGPEPAFHFINGVYAAPNIQLEAVQPETPAAPEGDPTPATA